MGLPKQEYWSGLPSPSPVDLPHLEIKPASPAWQADSLLSRHLGSTRPFKYDVNQIPYTVEVMGRYKGLDLVERVPEKL